jgi:preprotein translocase subunit SecF
VIYDRVRENFQKRHDMSPEATIDLSTNQTLSRTLLTSGLTLMVVLCLALLGGESLQGFSWALITGIVVGTYSSIYVAGTLSVQLGLKREHLVRDRSKKQAAVV